MLDKDEFILSVASRADCEKTCRKEKTSGVIQGEEKEGEKQVLS